jgi:hypothetical protein
MESEKFNCKKRPGKKTQVLGPVFQTRDSDLEVEIISQETNPKKL